MIILCFLTVTQQYKEIARKAVQSVLEHRDYFTHIQWSRNRKKNKMDINMLLVLSWALYVGKAGNYSTVYEAYVCSLGNHSNQEHTGHTLLRCNWVCSGSDLTQCSWCPVRCEDHRCTLSTKQERKNNSDHDTGSCLLLTSTTTCGVAPLQHCIINESIN